MILSNVNIGTGPSSGDGDPLRTAFNTINTNFTHIQNNVNSLTNSVSSVAGRTGNITLTTQDIVGINNYATVSYVSSQLANAGASNISSLQSNVAALQADVNTLYGNAGVQSATLATLTSNAATQAGILETLTSNAASQAGELITLLGNAAVQAGDIASLLANAGSQHEAISNLQSNAAVQAGLIADLQTSAYGNSNVASYLIGYSGNITVGNVIFDDLSVQTTAYTGTQWRSNLESNVRVKPSWLSYVPGGKNQEGTQYGFDTVGMFFTGNADNDFAYPIQTNLHFHEQDVLEVIATIYFGATNNDHGLCIFPADERPIWQSSSNTTRIAFQYTAGIPVLYGQTTANTAPGSPVLSTGNYYTIKFKYDPGNTVVVETFSGNTATGSPVDTRSLAEVLPAGDYRLGFDADNDAAGVKSYWTNLVVRTLTNTVVNDLEVQGQIIGNLIPSANVTYSLGNITHQWKDLYVSSNTIYIGGDTLSISSGNLTINGNIIPTADYVDSAISVVTFDQDLNTTDNVTFANIVTSTGQITVPTDTDFALRLNHSTFGEANVIVSSQGYMEVTGGYVGRSFTQILPGEVGATGYFGFTGNITNISGINGLILDTGLEGSGGAWDFDTNGVLTAPGNITTTGTIVSDNGSGYQTLIDPDGITAVYNGNTVYTIAKGSGGGSIVAEEGKSFAIITNGEGPSGKQWTFGTDGSLSLAGKLQFPNGAEIRDTSGDLRLRSSPGNVTQLQGIDGSGFVDSAVKAFYDSGSFVTIHTNIDAGSPEYIWSFDYNGDLTVPNYIKFAGNTFVGDEPGGGPEFRIVTPLGYGATIETDSDMSGNNWVWSFGTDGSLTLPGELHGAPVMSIGPTPSQVGRTVNITPADDASDKKFRFRVDQYAGQTFTRAYLELPTAEVDKQVAAVFPHANGKAGFIYTQGNDTNGQGMNDAFNIFYNNGDIKITSMGSSGGLYTWKFGDSGELTFPDATVQNTAWTGTVAYGNTIAIGYQTGNTSQGNNAVAIGSAAGQTSQGGKAIGIGEVAGRLNQGIESIGLGAGAGEQNQGAYAIAIGSTTAYLNQGVGAVAIGTSAGALYQGEHAIAIGTGAGNGLQGNNSIILNATGSTLDQTTDDTFTVKPIRASSAGNVLYYNPSSGEITYSNSVIYNQTLNTTDTVRFAELAVGISGSLETIIYNDAININGSWALTESSIETFTGNISGNVSGYAIGYRDVPQVSAGNVTLGLTDAGKHYYSTTSAPTTLTIPSNANVAFPIGTAITVVNSGTGNITISKQAEANLYLAGNSTSATRTLTSYGMATLLKTATNQWFINGTGLV